MLLQLAYARHLEKSGKVKVASAILCSKYVCEFLIIVQTQMIYVVLERDCTPFVRGAHTDHVIWLYMGDRLFHR
jgi:hypothetical protein